MIKRNLFLIPLFIITAIYYIPIINLPLAPYDEAVILVGAEKVLKGQIPHKDFSSEYPAGQLYTLALFFKVFGTSVITERVYDLIIKTFLSLAVFLIIRSLSSNINALVGWIMSLIWLQYSSFPAYPVYPSILFVFIGIYCLLLHMTKQKNYYVVLSAMSIVMAVLFRHDIGGYAAIAITIVLTFRMIVGVQSRTPLVIFVATGTFAIIALFIYFFMNSAASFIFNDLFMIPLAFREYQVLPYPSFSRWNLPFFMFPLVLVTGAITSIISIKRKKDDSTAYVTLFISLIGIFFLNQVKARSDVIHLLPVAITGILLAPLLLYILSKELSLTTLQHRVVYVMFIIFFGITLSKPIEVITRLLSTTNGYIVENVNPDIKRACHLNINADLKDAIAYIKNNTSKNDSIYVGAKNHDKFVFNDVIIYFLAERQSATRYHILNPGVHTTLKVQREVVNELINNLPPLVVLTQRSPDEPNLSNVDTQVDLLDDYISNNYELIKTYGIYELWIKKA
jgi:hypothetical protein